MKLQMHSIRFDADQKLIDFIQKKADKLDRFFDRIIDGEVFMRLDKDNNMENKIIEIKLNIPKNQLFAKERAKII
jgi:putative sigma-54 modulation protein